MSDKIPGLSWTCPYSGEEVKIGDHVDLVNVPAYGRALTPGRAYVVEELGVSGRDAFEAVLLTNDAGVREYYILDHLRKAPKPENTGQQTE